MEGVASIARVVETMQMTTLILKKNLQGSLHRIHCRYFSKFNFPKIRSAKKDEIAKIGIYINVEMIVVYRNNCLY